MNGCSEGSIKMVGITGDDGDKGSGYIVDMQPRSSRPEVELVTRH